MTSEVSICNQALGWIGGKRITALTDSSEEAILCNTNYADLRDAVLEDVEWTFAITRFEPAALVDAPLFGFDKAFQIPGYVLRVLQATNASEEATASNATGLGRYSEVEWVREGDQILANGVERIYVRAIRRIEDVSKFSPGFVQALAARLAMDLAIPISGSRTLANDMADLYGVKKRLASATDGMQGRSQKTRSNSLIRVR